MSNDARVDANPPSATNAEEDGSVTESKLLPGKQFHSADRATVNAELYTAVEDAVKGIAGLRVNLSDEVSAIKDAVVAATQRSREAVAHAENELRPPRPIVVTRANVTEAAKLQLQPDFLEKYVQSNEHVEDFFRSHAARAANESSPEAVATVGSVSALDAQASLAPSPTKDAATPTSTVGAVVPPILVELRSDRTRLARREELNTDLRRIKDEVLPLGDEGAMQAVLDACELDRADPLRVLRSELQSLAQGLAGVEAQVGQVSDERRAALQSEEMGVAENLASTAIDMFEDLLQRIRDRVKHSTDAASDIDEFGGELASVKQRVEEALAQLTSDTAGFVRSAVDDVAALAAWHRESTEADRRNAAAYKDASAAMASQLQQCDSEETELWRQLSAVLAKMEVVHTRREELVGKQLASIEAEKIRKASVAARTLAHDEHRTLLEGLQHNLKGAEEFIESVKEASERAFHSIDRHQWPRKQNDLVVRECARYHDAYLRFVLFAGEQVHRAEHRQANVKRLLRGVEFQVKTAADMLDVELPLYREQQRRYEQALTTVENRLEDLRQRQRSQTTQWAPIEACLDDNDVEFQPPELALQELQRDLTKDHCAAVDDLAAEEQKLVEQERRQVRNMVNLCDATKAVITERRQTRASAKKSAEDSSATASPVAQRASETSDEGKPMSGSNDAAKKLDLSPPPS